MRIKILSTLLGVAMTSLSAGAQDDGGMKPRSSSMMERPLAPKARHKPKPGSISAPSAG